MNDSTDFEWYDTAVLLRLLAPMLVLLAATFLILVALALVGVFSEMFLLIAFIFILVPALLGFQTGFKKAIKRSPSAVGVSANGIRFLYMDGHHKDILWDEIDGILLPGWRGPKRIVHKNGETTVLYTPDRIAFKIQKRYHEYEGK